MTERSAGLPGSAAGGGELEQPHADAIKPLRVKARVMERRRRMVIDLLREQTE
jgi:hypothetical protein